MKQICILFLVVILGITQNGYASKILTIQGKDYRVDTLRHVKVGPGTKYTALLYTATDNSKKFRGFFTTFDMKNNPSLQFRMEIGQDSTLSVERPSSIAKRKTKPNNYYIAGINSDFYITSSYVPKYVGMPHMDCIMEGEVASTGYVPAKDYGHFFMDYNKNMWCAHPTQEYKVTLPSGASVNLARVNMDVFDNEIVLFNSKYGKYTPVEGVTEVALELGENEKWKVNGEVKMKVVGQPSTVGHHAIPVNGAVLSAMGDKAASVEALKDGDMVSVNLNFKMNEFDMAPDIKMCSGGDVILLNNDTPEMNAYRYINGRDGNNPRTMVGYDKDRTIMVWGLIDGRSSISDGCTYPEGADVMRDAGCYDALNLDGGGSSTMYIQGLDVMNQPSDGSERAVANGMFAVLDAPEDNTIAEIQFVDYAMKFPKYGIYTPKFYGYNKYGMLIDTDVKGVTLSCPNTIGVIQNDSTFFGNGMGIELLTAHLGTITTAIPVTVVEPEGVSYRIPNLLIDGYRKYKVEVQATVNEELMPIDAAALAWSSNDENIATVEANTGVISGVSNGTVKVNGTVGTFSGDINVTVEKPSAHVMPMDANLDVSTWKLTQSGGKDIAATPFENGVKITYTGASGRAPNIKMAKTLTLWSLPDAMQLRINPGESEIKSVSFNVKTAIGTAKAIVKTGTLTKNTENIITLPTEEWCDAADLASFPLTLYNITLNMGTSTTGTEYQILIPGMELVYNSVSGVNATLKDNNALSIYPNPVIEGEMVTLNIEPNNSKVDIFNIAGKLVKSVEAISNNGSISLSTSGLGKGIYFVSIGGATSKLIIK